ncbi:MAG: 2-oxoglutarate dehydrogenase subunit E1, partial [Planctomycetes bacterium]|nr:2-oxoglutarate dehydrogenase subunit E1 [Planctomycetota bacterium]
MNPSRDLSQWADAGWIETLHERYRQNPESVHPSWAHFFQGFQYAQSSPVENEGGGLEERVLRLIRAFRRYGHLRADTDPLGLKAPASHPLLETESYGISPADLDRNLPTDGLLETPLAPLRQTLDALRTTYCGHIGIEYADLLNTTEVEWIRTRIEPTQNRPELTLDDRRSILTHLNHAELFELFLHKKYVGQKRFSLEGAEVLIPALADVIDKGSELGIGEFVIGMAHRGRLNVLCNILHKSYQDIFSEFEDHLSEHKEGTGDVKYHKGYSSTIKTRSDHEVHISLCSNPSHLEAVDPVALGRTRAKQVLKGDDSKSRILPVLIHGDASMAGQGVVYECLQMSGLPSYSVGGCLHIVLNNQIGFTTPPSEGRTSQYCTDVALVIQSPVWHVN